jgi:tetratricopeptide (TPR) repeat protein
MRQVIGAMASGTEKIGSGGLGRAVALALGCLVAACTSQPSPGPAAAARNPVPSADEPAIPTASAYGSYLAGSLAQREHAYGAAADYLERSLQQDPDNTELMRRAFLLRLGEGEMKRADELARRLAVVDPRSGLPALVLVVEQVKAGDDAGAAMSADHLPQDGLLRFSAPLVVAWTKAGQHDEKGALAALNRFDSMRGFDQLKLFHLALIEDYVGDINGASQAYKKILSTPERLNWRTADMAGGFFERHQRVGEATALYQRFAIENRESGDLVEPSLARVAAGQVPPPPVATMKDGLAEAMFDIAALLNQRDTQDLALLYARLALELKPNHALALFLAAEIAEGEQRLGEALATYRAIDPASPFSWSARLRSAEVLDELDRTDEATAVLKAMAAERPGTAQPLIELGDLLRGRNRFADAVAAYNGAVARLNPVEPRHWSIFYSRGIALERSGNWSGAEADFQHALELQPEQPLVLNYLGYSWIEKRQNLDRALKMIERAVQLRPNDGYIVDSLGWAYYQLGSYPQAAQYLERAIELLPEDPTINDHLGDAYWRIGRTSEARYQWRRALQFQPEADQVKIIDAKLDKGLTAAPGVTSRGG